jgi:plastocyanin
VAAYAAAGHGAAFLTAAGLAALGLPVADGIRDGAAVGRAGGRSAAIPSTRDDLSSPLAGRNRDAIDLGRHPLGRADERALPHLQVVRKDTMLRTLPAIVVVLAAGAAACSGNRAPAATENPSSAAPKAAGRRATVDMSDYRFAPANLTARPGTLVITAKNTGRQPHELVLLRTNNAPDAFARKAGKASESTSVGEISERAPGANGTHTFKLAPGKYVYICNVDGHYALGMRGTLVVK